jgi:hypothetical protein
MNKFESIKWSKYPVKIQNHVADFTFMFRTRIDDEDNYSTSDDIETFLH